MKLSDWILGPQLPGFICIVAALIQIYFPPKNINGLDLYFTSSEETNRKIGDEARQFFPRYLLKISSIFFVVGVLITTVLNLTIETTQTRKVFNYMFMIMSLPFCMPMVIMKTQQRLEKMFKSKDEIR